MLKRQSLLIVPFLLKEKTCFLKNYTYAVVLIGHSHNKMDKSDETFGKKYWVNLENLSEIDKRQFPVFDLPVLPK